MLKQFAVFALALVATACAGNPAPVASPQAVPDSLQADQVGFAVENSSWSAINIDIHQGSLMPRMSINQLSSGNATLKCTHAGAFSGGGQVKLVVDPISGEPEYTVPLQVTPDAGQLVVVTINEYDPYSTVADVRDIGLGLDKLCKKAGR